jgi:hypothetical protein
MRTVIYLSFILLVTFFSACNTDTESYSSYFNIESALRSHVAILYREKAMLIKTAQSGTAIDNIKYTKPDWNLELEHFRKLSISSASYEGKYKVDTSIFYPIRNDRSIVMKRVTYTAMEQDLPVSSLEVVFDSKQAIYRISGKTNSSDFMTTITKSYTYIPFKSYSMYASETTRWMGTSTYQVEGEIYFEEPYFE